MSRVKLLLGWKKFKTTTVDDRQVEILDSPMWWKCLRWRIQETLSFLGVIREKG